MPKIKWSWAIFTLGMITVLTFATRFINTSWGLPFPFHPDERNMAVAIQSLNCGVSNFKFQISDFQTCFNPHFFAYGQLPLYLGLLLIFMSKALSHSLGVGVSFDEAILALRVISAASSFATVFLLIKIIQVLQKKPIPGPIALATGLLFIFSPALIQFAHFGTTESLLMLLFSLLIYFSIELLQNICSLKKFIYLSSLAVGLAIATKVSSVLFIITPLLALGIYLHEHKGKLTTKLMALIKFGLLVSMCAIIFSPQNLISIKEFLGSLTYETEVARGMEVFYTRSFFETTPILFQLRTVFPYALGLPISTLFLISFFILPYNKINNFLRLSFLAYFLPASFLYAKWTRFMAPIIPLVLIFCAMLFFTFFQKTKTRRVFMWILTLLCILPGIAYMSIYLSPDVRATASVWINQNVPNNSHLLLETANVVDIPLSTETIGKQYNVTSFNFYDLDVDPVIQDSLKNKLKEADYIFIPSRRIFANHTCLGNFQFSIFNFQTVQKCKELKNKYPILNEYYKKLFSGELGFVEVAKFSSYPKITIGGKTLFIIPDEESEETWTVFDHPVIRIYKKRKQVDF